MERVKDLDQQMRGLQPSTEFNFILEFVRKIEDRAAELPGDLTPPLGNWLHADLMPRLAIGCQILGCHVFELVATGWYRAGIKKPEVFAQGCDDPTAHEAYIEELKAEGEKL